MSRPHLVVSVPGPLLVVLVSGPNLEILVTGSLLVVLVPGPLLVLLLTALLHLGQLLQGHPLGGVHPSSFEVRFVAVLAGVVATVA